MPPNSRFIEISTHGGTCWQVDENDAEKLRYMETYVRDGWLVLNDVDGTDLYIHPRDIIAWELSTPETRANAKALQAQIDSELEEPRQPWD